MFEGLTLPTRQMRDVMPTSSSHARVRTLFEGESSRVLYIGAMMTAVFLLFMLGMSRNNVVNGVIFGGAAVVFTVALYLARSQILIGDVACMKAMIPHRSISILTSSRANITDARVRRLADSIDAAQKREIGRMETLIRELEQR